MIGEIFQNMLEEVASGRDPATRHALGSVWRLASMGVSLQAASDSGSSMGSLLLPGLPVFPVVEA